MSDNSAPSRQVSYEQLKNLMDFMGQHVEFATGNVRTLEARHASKRLWGEVAKILNNCRIGTKKTANGWSRYWSDFKNKLKNKARLLKKHKRLGSTSGRGVTPLTKMEKRALVILGPHFVKKISGSKDPFVNSLEGDSPPQVKLEGYKENMRNEFSLEQKATNDRLSDGESESAESNNEESDDEAEMSNQSVLQSIYPKWLINVEKQRADAELLRAKAEEQRVAVAMKAAEAALLQAQALKTLSEAATVQANAFRTIAMVLEDRDHRPDLLSI